MTTSTHVDDTSFLQTLRDALVPGVTEPRMKKDVPEIFASSDPAPIMDRINSRNDLDFSGLVQLFIDNSTPLNLHVHKVVDHKHASETIAEIVSSTEPEFGKAKHIIQHSHPDIHALQLWHRFENQPVSLHTTLSADPEVRAKTEASYIGITCADWGIAESATLVQLTRPEQPRSTSLVPSIHIGLVQKKNLLHSLDEAYWSITQETIPTSMTFISGPSKTADIEAHMVHGAHGPREMHVIILG